MKIAAVLSLMAIVFLGLSGCGRQAEIYNGTMKILGSVANVSIVGLSEKEAKAAIDAVERELDQLDQIGYIFEPEGELYNLNAALAANRSFAISSEFAMLLHTADSLSRASGGLFNPAAGALTTMWEFRCDSENCTKSPYPDEVRHLINRRKKNIINRKPSMNDLRFDGSQVSSKNPAVQLEFGDIIRGFALDRGMERLKNRGVQNAMIQFKGSTRTIGSRGGHPWWVEVSPANHEFILGSIEDISEEAVVTVSAFDKPISEKDTLYRPVIDSRTGLPVKAIQSVTVVHDSATVANVAAVVFLVNGVENWSELARKMGVQALLIITADGTVYASPRMEERLHWKREYPHHHLIPKS